MSGSSWSQRLENHYSLRLPDDVCAWVDDQVWKEPGGAEFCRAQSPDQLLDPEPGCIWAGFMLPDTLPIIGNDYGDWLCLRIAPNGSVSELLHWSHCGGDWLPYGRSLAEAILYDAASYLLRPSPAEFVDRHPSEAQKFRAAEWARHWIPSCQGSVERFWSSNGDATVPTEGPAILEVLSRADVADIAVRRDRILQFLESPLKTASDSTLAQSLGVSWEPDFVHWLFDTAQIPVPARHALTQHFKTPEASLFTQDWVAAESAAEQVIQQRCDLGWAFDVAGWAAERRGDRALAVQRYFAGMQTSWFSDDTLRFRTHWFDEAYGKFAVARLRALTPHLSPEQSNDRYLRVFLEDDTKSLRARVKEFWIRKAREASRQGAYLKAYQCYYRAGWDLGLHPVTCYGEVFDGLIQAAAAAGAPALKKIAKLHRRFLN